MDPLSFLDNFIAMSWFTALFVLLIGILLLWFCSDVVVRTIKPIARYFGVKELVVTILGVSILSSLPELAVSSIILVLYVYFMLGHFITVPSF